MRLLAVLLATPLLAAPDPEALRFFETKIRPVLATRCYGCHSAQTAKPQGGLLLDSATGVQKGGNSGALVDTADPDRSLLLRALRYQDKELKMPPGKPLPADVVADFAVWLRAGAPMPPDAPSVTKSKAGQHWAFIAPKNVTPPSVQRSGWVRNPIDQFVLAKLEQKGLAPNPPADRRTLIRRVTFDLTGLPPTAEEIAAFVADDSANAYERLIDRLLASPHYGERWGRHWLDVARYSDARNVGERFAYSYTYRDWVIRALNADMPYDQFLVQQLAADRLPGNPYQHLAALGYLSLGREFPKSFPETVDDRIDVVARGMLGLTVACARCHDHKYDPIPTKDYYSFYSIFSNIREPRDLPLLRASSQQSALDQTYQRRLERIRQTDADYRVKRLAEMVKFFQTQTAEYLLAVRDAHKLSATETEELVRDRQLNLHVLARWRDYLRVAKANDPVWGLWLAAASIPEADFSAKWPAAFAEQTGANPLLRAELLQRTPASPRDVAQIYEAVLLRQDSTSPHSDPSAESLRLALRGPQAPVSIPLDEFELIYTEGDGNNTRGFARRYETMLAMYAYAGGTARAMALEDVPAPKPAHVFVRGNPNNPGVETPPHALTCLSSGEPVTFRDGSGRLDLARSIASRDNPLTARVAANRVWMHHFGAGIVRTPSDFGIRGDTPTHPELLDWLAVRLMEDGWSLKKLHRTILLSATYQQSSEDNPAARRVDPENTLLWRMSRRRLEIEALRDAMLAAAGQLDRTAGGVPFSLAATPAVPRRTVYGYVERGRVPGFLSMFDFASPDTHAPMRYVTTVPQQALFLLNSGFVAEQARYLAHRPDIVMEAEPARRIARMYRAVFGREATARELMLGQKFVETAELPPHEKPEPEVWQYGVGELDTSAGKLKSFAPFRYFTGDSWQGASMLPDPKAGKARLRSNGGEPGDTPQQAVVRRWLSPEDGKLTIEGILRHNQDSLGTGDGVRARIISSRHGELASWVVNGTSAETKLAGIKVEKGDTIDFVVDGREDTENDAFTWAPTIQSDAKQKWSAASDFKGPAAQPLSAWERYAQVLLETNEFTFVD